MLEPDKPFEEARQMGFGWSPGDTTYDQPYFYINPYGIDRPDSLPSLPSGSWSKHCDELLLAEVIPGECQR